MQTLFKDGSVVSGRDADIVLYDPGAGHVIRSADCVSHADYTPYEGFVTSGRIRQVWLRGRKVAEEGTVLDASPAGRYIARGKCTL